MDKRLEMWEGGDELKNPLLVEQQIYFFLWGLEKQKEYFSSCQSYPNERSN
jgi:hypothetical protein